MPTYGEMRTYEDRSEERTNRQFEPSIYPPPLQILLDVSDDRAESPDVTVQDLPGLNLSMCLAILDSTGDAIAAREAMASTLLRFPIMLEPLLEK